MDNLDQITPQIHVNKIYDLLETVDSLFRGNGIEYTISCGTLLGAIRHGGLIPWDDDIDIGILNRDVEKFRALFATFERKGYGTSDTKCIDLWGVYKLFPLDGDHIPNGNNSEHLFPSADIFPYKDEGDMLVYNYEIARSQWPNEYIYAHEWEGIEDIQFGHLLLRGLSLKYSERYLSAAYGNKWATHGVKEFDHRRDKEAGVSEFLIHDFQPALKSEG